MRAILQRVTRARVDVGNQTVAEIGCGLLILIGAGMDDNAEKAETLAKKIANLRIFSDAAGKMNLSLLDTGGAALVVSQFTLFADTRKGNRPSFTGAMPPDTASPLVDQFANFLRAERIPVQQGIFGAHMVIELVNDGPVTITLES
ncbi:MAG: D-tyrosyl-tRNA(Tyr) deacylase [Anaerolinea sp.]|nr:D-tyrosyl-tRNA(Tyr) deacylase [Anaerolinea sp.]